jgi:DNA primase
MAINFDDFIEQVRDANPIEDVLEESGIKLRGHGRLRTAAQHDSLKVRTDMGRAFWYSKNWNGDVFAWIMSEKGCDFMQAVEILARRAHLDMPRFAQVNESEVKRLRATTDVFSVAATVFHRWLEADKEALDYAHSRAWTDHTIKESLLGFSGRKTAEQIHDMKGEFSLYGIDPCSPAAVAVLGMEGDVGSWAVQQGIRDDQEYDLKWSENGRIHGLMDTPGLIYVHQFQGGVKYLSRRQLPGFDKIKSDGKQRDWKSFNPYKLLAGPKQPYFNQVHRMDRALVCVEGQGDAISYGQVGQGAMAFCGLMGDTSTMATEDAERIRKLTAYINKHPAVYLSLDEDEAGQKAVKLAARLLGPKVQIVRMSRTWTREDAEAEKTAGETSVEESSDV